MAYIDDFRALASVAIAKDLKETTRSKAELLLHKIMETMDKSIQIEDHQADEFLKRLNSNIEVIKQ